NHATTLARWPFSSIRASRQTETRGDRPAMRRTSALSGRERASRAAVRSSVKLEGLAGLLRWNNVTAHVRENNDGLVPCGIESKRQTPLWRRSEEHTSELQSRFDSVCSLL